MTTKVLNNLVLFQNQIDQFNAEKEFQTDQWNAANAQAIEQSNVNWRRNANTADTAAQNAINQQNAMNAFGLQKAALDSMWQQLRDEATYEQQAFVNFQSNLANLYATALSSEYPQERIQDVQNLILEYMNGAT